MTTLVEYGSPFFDKKTAKKFFKLNKKNLNDKNGFETSWYDANTLYPMRIESDTYLTNVNYYMSDCPLSDEEMTFTDFNNYEEVIDDEYN